MFFFLTENYIILFKKNIYIMIITVINNDRYDGDDDVILSRPRPLPESTSLPST